MNILQQIWTDSNVFLTFFVNLVHSVSLVPVIGDDMVTVGETACVQFRAHLTSDLKVCTGLRLAYYQEKLIIPQVQQLLLTKFGLIQ